MHRVVVCPHRVVNSSQALLYRVTESPAGFLRAPFRVLSPWSGANRYH